MGYFNTSLFIVALNLKARRRFQVPPRRIQYYFIIKRVLETILSLLLLILLAPVFLLFTLAIRLDSPGPALFRQERVGKHGKSFTFYKFRTMHHDIDRSAHQAYLAAYIAGSATRGVTKPLFKPSFRLEITSVGQLLRRTSLDELPQLINILKGDMSFIGPRPNVPAEVQAYQEWHKKRLEVLPGITGWAQVNGRSSIPFDQIVQYDIEYVENMSLRMDLKVLWTTVPTILRGSGAK